MAGRIAVDSALREGPANVMNVNLPDANIKTIVGPNVTEEEMVAFRAAVKALIEKHLKEVVYPALAQATIAKVKPYVEQCLAEGKYDKACEEKSCGGAPASCPAAFCALRQHRRRKRSPQTGSVLFFVCKIARAEANRG